MRPLLLIASAAALLALPDAKPAKSITTIPKRPTVAVQPAVKTADCACENCTCDPCECEAAKPEVSVVAEPKTQPAIGYGAPITLAPVADTKPALSNYDADKALRLFQERHRTPVRGIFRPGAAAPRALPPPPQAAAPSNLPPIDRNHATGYWETVCSGGSCYRVWRSYQPTRQVQQARQPVQQYQNQRRAWRLFR